MPYKASFIIVMFLFFLAGTPTVVADSGTGEYLNIQPDVCQEQLSDGSEIESFETNTGSGDTLFGLYNSLAQPFESLFNNIIPGAAMLKCAGVPAWMVNFGLIGLALIPGRDLAVFLRSG